MEATASAALPPKKEPSVPTTYETEVTWMGSKISLNVVGKKEMFLPPGTEPRSSN